jgi:hypothetical protein
MILSWRWVGAGAGLAAMVMLTGTASAEPAVTAITCTNPASGFTWQIKIDFANSTVDSNPAQISASEITWFDPKDDSSYTLDRASGKLTKVFASATGGNFLFHRCAVSKSG